MICQRRLSAGVLGALLVAAATLPALRADAAPRTLGAVAMASEEPTATAAGDVGALAVVDMTVDGATGDICVRATVTGLSGPLTAAHIHSGAPGVNGPITVPLPVSGASVTGCVVATPAQAQAISDSPASFYFNAHTAASPAGALRGQLTSTMFNATMAGASEVPGPGDPDGTGAAVVALDTSANRACVHFTVSAVDLPATGAHIHSGATGVAGPIVVPLTAPGAPLAASCGQASAAVIGAIAANPGAHYANFHTSPFPGGAVRGQLVLRSASGVPVPAPTSASVVATLATVPTTTAAPTTVAATTTLAAATTLAPTTTVAATTTVATTTVATTVAPTTAPPQSTAAPAEAITETPEVTG